MGPLWGPFSRTSSRGREGFATGADEAGDGGEVVSLELASDSGGGQLGFLLQSEVYDCTYNTTSSFPTSQEKPALRAEAQQKEVLLTRIKAELLALRDMNPKQLLHLSSS